MKSKIHKLLFIFINGFNEVFKVYAKHKIYAAIFNILRKFPQKNNKITLLTNKNHSFEANLEYIAKELDNRNNSRKNYECNNR